MRAIIKKWGSSAAIEIPRALIDATNFRIDDMVYLRAEAGKIVIELIPEIDCDLDELLDRITSENLHDAVDFGTSAGREAF